MNQRTRKQAATKPTIEDEGLKDLDDYTQEDDLKSLPDDN